MPDSVKTQSLREHSAWLEISLAAVNENLRSLQALQLKGTKTLAVVKAGAYGHGLVPVAKGLESAADYLGVSSLREVQALTEAGIKTPVFLFSRLLPSEVKTAVASGAAITVSSVEEADQISKAAGDQTVRIHVKVDTGMGRLGMPFSKAIDWIKKISELPSLDMEGIYTHFPVAEASDGFTDRQMSDFILLIQALEKEGISFRLRHAANSAACVKVKSPALNMIRPGIMLYGIYPHASLRDLVVLRPALSLKSRFISVKRVQPGQSVGYGREFVAERPSNIGIIPVGYSHGYPVRASAQARILSRGEWIPLAGRVSMDYLAVNLGDRCPVIGEEVTLLGRDGSLSISAEDIAGWAGTIPYEIVTGLSRDLPRLYTESGAEHA